MPTQKTSNLAAILWFVAAALAITAFAIRAARGEMAWYIAAAAAFLLVMGISALRRRGVSAESLNSGIQSRPSVSTKRLRF